MLLNQDQDLLADLSIAICSSYTGTAHGASYQVTIIRYAWSKPCVPIFVKFPEERISLGKPCAHPQVAWKCAGLAPGYQRARGQSAPGLVGFARSGAGT